MLLKLEVEAGVGKEQRVNLPPVTYITLFLFSSELSHEQGEMDY